MWIEPIYDRTRADVDLIRLDPTNANTKGAYNYTDLNRIEVDCEYVANEYNKKYASFEPLNLKIKTDWKVTDIPTITELNRIRNNIKTLMEAVNDNLEQIEFTNTMDYKKANILEKNLSIIKYVIEFYKKELRTCNMFYCGIDGMGIYASPVEFVEVFEFAGDMFCGEDVDL